MMTTSFGLMILVAVMVIAIVMFGLKAAVFLAIGATVVLVFLRPGVVRTCITKIREYLK
jgi:hypothetical protein